MTFEELYEAYGKKILILSYRFTGNEESARDLTQDIFLKIYEKLNTFEHKSGYYTWIYRIAINHCLNFLKKERRWRWYAILEQPVGEALRSGTVSHEKIHSGGNSSPESSIEKKEREMLVLKMVQSLPLKYRAPLILQRYEGMNNREIAEALSVPLSTIDTRIHRAKKLLIRKLEPWMDDL